MKNTAACTIALLLAYNSALAAEEVVHDAFEIIVHTEFGRCSDASVESLNRPALCSLTGGVLMVSDVVDVCRDDSNLEGMKRKSLINTKPQQSQSFH